jgi:regulator of sigma E protease
MTSFLGSVFWLLVTLGVLVTFHEFGHYWVARRCGVKVLRFSVGFGNAIWKRFGRDGTEYRIAAIPLGGYVKMLDAREGEVDPALAAQEFTGKPVWQRIAIVIAGPAFNLLFTVLALWLMFVIGKPDVVPVVAAAPQGLAAQAGVRSGDRVLKVDGSTVITWSDAYEKIATATLDRQPLSIEVRGADGRLRDLQLPLQQLPPGKAIDESMSAIGLDLNPPPPIIAVATPGQPAALAGIRSGDRIVSVNGQTVADFAALSRLITQEAAKAPTLRIVVQRGEQTLPFKVQAHVASLQGQPARWVIGVGPMQPQTAVRRYGPVEAAGAALVSTRDGIVSMFTMIGKLITGESSTRNLSGVIGIAQAAQVSAQLGLAWFLNFLAMVSLSLAVLNLLPIPVLDGGHLLYYLIELVKGSPLSERAMIIGQYVGLALLCMLMGLALYNDIHRTLLS